MFEDLMEQSNEMQSKINAKLEQINIEVESGGVTFKGLGTGVIQDIHIPESLMNTEGKEQLEDLLIAAISEFNAEVATKNQEVSQKMLDELLPGGFGNLFG